MDSTFQLVLGLIWLVVALVGTAAGWVAVARMRRWCVAQAALLPALHVEMVETRHRLLQQVYEVDRQAQEVAGRLDTGGRDLAVLLLSSGFARMTGRSAGFWGPIVARMIVSRVGPAGATQDVAARSAQAGSG